MAACFDVSAGTSSREVRVVVADDSPSLRRLVQLTLGLQPGVRIVGEAVDGAEAVEAARREQPDLVLLDIAMPVMDGLEALPLIRRDVPRARVLVLSAYSSAAMAEIARAAGADGYLEKWATDEELLDAIRTIFPELPRADASPVQPVGPPVDGERRSPTDPRYVALLDALEEAVLVVGRDGRVEAVNFSATRLFRRGTSELIGSSVGHLLEVRPEASCQRQLDPVTATLRTARPRDRIWLSIRLPDGGTAAARANVRPLLRPGEDVAYGVVATFVTLAPS